MTGNVQDCRQQPIRIFLSLSFGLQNKNKKYKENVINKIVTNPRAV